MGGGFMTLLIKNPSRNLSKLLTFYLFAPGENKANYLFITAPENVAWLLNIRGHDNPNSPIPNCRLIIDSNKEIFLICEKIKAQNLIKEKKIKKIKSIKVDDYTHLEVADFFDNIIEFKLDEGLKLSLYEKFKYRKMLKEKYINALIKEHMSLDKEVKVIVGPNE